MKNYQIFIFLFVSFSLIQSAAGQPGNEKSNLPANFNVSFNVPGSLIIQPNFETDGFTTALSYSNPHGLTYDTILCFDTLNNLNARLIRLYNDSSLLTDQTTEQFNGSSIIKNSHTYYKYYSNGNLKEREYHISGQSNYHKEKTIYSYFDNGKTIYMDTYFWQDSAWKQTNTVQLFYDNRNLMTGQKYYFRSMVTHELALYRTIDWTYNEAGNLLTESSITVEDGLFVRSDSLSNTYDPSGLIKIQEWIKYRHDSVTSSFETKDFIYDTEWQLTSILYSSGSDSNMHVRRSDSLIYSNGKLFTNTTKYYNYIIGELAVSSQIRYTYPEDNVIVKTNLSIVADTLSPANILTKTYDENGDLLESFFENIRPNPGIFRIHYEIENRNSIKGINEKLVNGIWMPNNTSSLYVQCQGEDVTGGLYETYQFSATFRNPESQGKVENSTDEPLLIYPNPARSHITVKLNVMAGSNSQIRIIDATGRIVAGFALNNGVKLVEAIDISNLKSGFYTLLYITDGKVVSQTKVVKN